MTGKSDHVFLSALLDDRYGHADSGAEPDRDVLANRRQRRNSQRNWLAVVRDDQPRIALSFAWVHGGEGAKKTFGSVISFVSANCLLRLMAAASARDTNMIQTTGRLFWPCNVDLFLDLFSLETFSFPSFVQKVGMFHLVDFLFVSLFLIQTKNATHRHSFTFCS